MLKILHLGSCPPPHFRLSVGVFAEVSCLCLHSSDSEGTFETPEAESPGVAKLLGQLDNSNQTGELLQVWG